MPPKSDKTDRRITKTHLNKLLECGWSWNMVTRIQAWRTGDVIPAEAKKKKTLMLKLIYSQTNAPHLLQYNHKIATPTCFGTHVPSSGNMTSHTVFLKKNIRWNFLVSETSRPLLRPSTPPILWILRHFWRQSGQGVKLTTLHLLPNCMISHAQNVTELQPNIFLTGILPLLDARKKRSAFPSVKNFQCPLNRSQSGTQDLSESLQEEKNLSCAWNWIQVSRSSSLLIGDRADSAVHDPH